MRVEHVASCTLSDGHAQVGVETDPGNAHAGIVLVLRCEVDIVVMMVVMMVAGEAPSLCYRGHDASAEGSRCRMEGLKRRAIDTTPRMIIGCGTGCRCLINATQLWVRWPRARLKWMLEVVAPTGPPSDKRCM
jgi:hypothetical protein